MEEDWQTSAPPHNEVLAAKAMSTSNQHAANTVSLFKDTHMAPDNLVILGELESAIEALASELDKLYNFATSIANSVNETNISSKAYTDLAR